MARPRKLSTDEMLELVNDYYESCGDSKRLKCSFLEEYAVSRGFSVKAYDFRRNTDVRSRINELRDLDTLFTGAGAIAYRNLDVNAFIGKLKSKDELKNSLVELDETWRRIYDRAVLLAGKNQALIKDIQQKNLEYDALTCESTRLSEQLASLKKAYKEALLENRYLRKAIKTYLYPAIANELLKNENVLIQVDTEVLPGTMDLMTDKATPLSFSKSVAPDQLVLSREESILRRMQEQIFQEDGNA